MNPRVSLRKMMFFAGLLGALVSSCGLPQLVFLAPPIVDQGIPGNLRGFFTHNTQNTVDEFLGYDIWYKIYPDTDAGRTQAAQDAEALNRDTIGVGISPLQTRGFFRVITYSRATGASNFDRTAITVPIENPANPQEFEVDLVESNEPGATDTFATADIILNTVGTTDSNRGRGLRRRNLDASASDPADYASFWDLRRYQEATSVPAQSADITPSNRRQSIQDHANDPDPRFLILLYVITVGTDSQTLTPIYSEPRQIRGRTDRADGFIISPR